MGSTKCNVRTDNGRPSRPIRAHKMRHYAAARVSRDFTIRPEPFDALELELGNLWSPLT